MKRYAAQGLLAVAVVACFLPAALMLRRLATLPPNRPTLEEASASPVVDGMQLAVKSAVRHGDKLHFRYRLHCFDESRMAKPRTDLGPILVYFWDAAGNQIEPVAEADVVTETCEGEHRGPHLVSEVNSEVGVPKGPPGSRSNYSRGS
jgi:hypothetical protein